MNYPTDAELYYLQELQAEIDAAETVTIVLDDEFKSVKRLWKNERYVYYDPATYEEIIN